MACVAGCCVVDANKPAKELPEVVCSGFGVLRVGKGKAGLAGADVLALKLLNGPEDADTGWDIEGPNNPLDDVGCEDGGLRKEKALVFCSGCEVDEVPKRDDPVCAEVVAPELPNSVLEVGAG